jgi:hypothetical protein
MSWPIKQHSTAGINTTIGSPLSIHICKMEEERGEGDNICVFNKYTHTHIHKYAKCTVSLNHSPLKMYNKNFCSYPAHSVQDFSLSQC